MKKFVVIIVFLMIILIGMLIYRSFTIKKQEQNISVDEISQIETYVAKIYMWKEITGEALPTFSDINQADDVWIWEVVKKNLEDYELTYDEIQAKAKELFGPDFTKEFPKEGNDEIVYDAETGKYYALGRGIDEEEDSFLLNTITRTDNGYNVEIVEYLEDYSYVYGNDATDNNVAIDNTANIASNEENKSKIVIRNTNGDEVGEISSNQEDEAKDIVKENIDKFSKKQLEIKKDGDNLYVERVTAE